MSEILNPDLTPFDNLIPDLLAEIQPGQAIQLVSIEHPAGGHPARAEAHLLCRKA
jgi:hypothetical protein